MSLKESAKRGAVLLAVALSACGGPTATPAATASAQEVTRVADELLDGWVEVRPEPNLSLQMRDGWSANRAEDGKGPIVFTGPKGARVVVWPMFVASAAKMPTPEAVLTDFAKRDGNAFKWDAPATFGKDGVRMFGQSADAVAQASFVYNKTSVGMAGYWYLTSAPRADYAALQPIFAGLMKGVRIYGSGNQVAARPAQTYVAWQEPNEGAYVAQVPKDWRVRGGIIRPDPLRLLDPIELTSPDDKVHVFSGDGNLGLFKTPTQMELQMGLREGSQNGAAVLMRYRPAVQLLPDFLQKRFGARCGVLKIDDVLNQQDIADEANAQLAASTAPGNFQRVDVAAAAFHCGSDSVGVVQMATYMTGIEAQYGSEGFGMWQVSGVGGFIAPEDRAAEAGEVIIKLLTTRKVNKQWAQGNQQMVAQITAMSQKAAADLSAQIASRYSVSSSGTSGGSNGSVSDDLSRRWQNSTMDQTDVVDQATGERYKVESGSSYYWINQQGTSIAGTNAPSQPSIDYAQMTQLP
ncbi:MAG: hypothetical protein Q8R82_02335 [Hyphomonadaceae bacterium]|nr:hypothetical protein [Hyphomonadaceae bacterium]